MADLVEIKKLRAYNKKKDLKYKQLSVINSELFSKIKKIFILSKYESSDVIFITTNDEVFGFGDNKSGRLGLGHNKSVSEPTHIPELSSKQVINIECGYYHMVALTETHEVYTFGLDSYGRLGNGNNDKLYRKPQKLNLNDKSFVYINCCAYNTYLLTNDNTVYWFGYLPVDSIQANIPTIVDFDGKKIIDISCGRDHTLALTDCGEVYSLGSNDYGQLGLGHNNDLLSSQMIQMNENIKFKKISSGHYQSILLTTSGNIYSFGYNKEYQLGTGDTANKNIPMLILENCNISDIFAFEKISLAVNDLNRFYIWGMNYYKTPFPINIISFQDAIDNYSLKIFTYKPLSPEDVFYKSKSIDLCNRVMKTMSKAFNSQKNSDFKFKLRLKGSEDTFDFIYCYKWFIEENSEYFKKMFANNCPENKTNEIVIDNYTYEAFYHFIRYLYTDTIETENIEILIELLSITDQYLEEEMKTKCVQIIKPLMNVQNVCSLYSASKKFSSNELENICFKYMSENIKLITKTEDYEKMDSIYAKVFLTKLYEQ